MAASIELDYLYHIIQHLSSANSPFTCSHLPVYAQLLPSPGATTNPLDDHEPLLWSMRAGLTRAEVRQTGPGAAWKPAT